MADKSKKELWMEAMRAKHPEKKYENEDEMYGDSMEGYAKVKEERDFFENDNKGFVGLLTSDPNLLMFFKTIRENPGAKGIGMAIANLPDYARMSAEEQAAYDEEIKSRKAREEEAAAGKEAKAAALQASVEEGIAFAKENGMSEDEFTKMVEDFCHDALDAVNDGKMDKSFFEKMYRFTHYEDDMRASHEAGKRDGRNEAFQTKAKRMRAGDGLPNVKASGAARKEEKPMSPTEQALAGLERTLGRKHQLFG